MSGAGPLNLPAPFLLRMPPMGFSYGCDKGRNRTLFGFGGRELRGLLLFPGPLLLPIAPVLWPLPDGDIAYERRVQTWWGRWSVPFQAIHSADPSLCVWACAPINSNKTARLRY